MGKRVFVTATNTGIGKTFTTQTLLKECYKVGIKAGVFKPIETGVANIPIDGTKLLKKCQEFNNNFRKFMIGDIIPYQFLLPAAPYIAKKETKIDLDFLLEKAYILEKECDVLFIEGAGGLMVPVEKEIFMIDFIKIFDAKPLLVTPSRLGCINDTLLSIEALKNRGLRYEWCINLYKDKDSFFNVTYPFYKEYFDEILILQKDSKKILEKLIKNY